MKAGGKERRKGHSVSRSIREGQEIEGVGMRALLYPYRHGCNLGHVSHKACWSHRGQAE